MASVTKDSSAEEYADFIFSHYESNKPFWDQFMQMVLEKSKESVTQQPLLQSVGGRKKRSRRLKGGEGGNNEISFKSFILALPVILFIIGSFYIVFDNDQQLEIAKDTIFGMCEKFKESPMIFIDAMQKTTVAAVSSSIILTNRAIVKKVESALVGKDPFAISSLLGLGEKVIKVINVLKGLMAEKKPVDKKVEELLVPIIDQIKTNIGNVDDKLDKFKQMVIPENSILLIPEGSSITPVSGGRRRRRNKRSRRKSGSQRSRKGR